MASDVGEVAKMMLWMEVMYRLAADQGITPDSRLEDISVGAAVHTPVNPTTYRLSTFFPHDSQPTVSATLCTLLTSNKTRFRGLELRHRAIGSMCHSCRTRTRKGIRSASCAVTSKGRRRTRTRRWPGVCWWRPQGGAMVGSCRARGWFYGRASPSVRYIRG
ncbi:hypothetical protein B0T18DRAFT_414040 [Schizothecium vesticola]|uniref:Uncharacterized protein n=1 Tax=Schizothecium vesticola TaxID=314040 RepID=A0AA40EP40_9PEZI|nr:hypothetical protein B0T18DRAFT_414040 [Schizothecium vesticola]